MRSKKNNNIHLDEDMVQKSLSEFEKSHKIDSIMVTIKSMQAQANFCNLRQSDLWEKFRALEAIYDDEVQKANGFAPAVALFSKYSEAFKNLLEITAEIGRLEKSILDLQFTLGLSVRNQGWVN